MEEALKKAIEACAKRASDSEDANDALKFTQAAFNAANALATVSNVGK